MDLRVIGIILVLCVPFLLITVLFLVDVAQREFSTPREKIVWWMIVSIPFVGFIPYVLFGLRRGKKITEPQSPPDVQNNSH
jgi:H+/Cl- antiporter ClcA